MRSVFQRIKNSQSFQHVNKLISFLEISKVNKWYLFLSVLLSVLYTQAALYVVYLLFPLTQGIISNNFTRVSHLTGPDLVIKVFPEFFKNSTRLFVLLVAWIYLVTIIKNVFRYFAAYTSQTQARIATIRLRQLLVEKCLGFSKSFYDKNTISFLQTTLTKSTTLVESRFRILQQFTTEFLLVIAYLSVMFMISWKLMLLATITFPVIMLLTQRIIQKIRKVSLAQQISAKSLNERIFNMLYCMPVIKSFSKESDELNLFSKASEQDIEESFKIQKLEGLITPFEDIGAMTGILFIALGMAYILHSDHSLDASKAFVFFYLATKLMPGFNVFNRFKLDLAASTSSLNEIEQILENQDVHMVKDGDLEFSGLKESIQFKDLTFSYVEGGQTILEKMDFSVDKNSIVAIVGASGSGKSTIVNLLLRFYDCPPGRIFIDGQDIRDFKIPSLRKLIALVSQEVLLFNDTIRNNIIYGSASEVSDDALKELTQTIFIKDFIEKMPDKYETLVGERGGRISIGERQRISVVRAMIKEADIIVLDEATSALDSQTEARISEGIMKIAQGKTIIMVTHRLSTIKKADKIVYLDKGRIIEQGTFQELIDKKGLFYKQWELQRV